MLINILRKMKATMVKELKWAPIRKSFLSNLKKKSVFLLGTPLHCNIGDQAITLAEYDFFKSLGYAICEVPSPFVASKIEFLKKYVKKEKIFVHGGGFIGSLWPDEEVMFETILREFPNNEIIVLPQTVFFNDDDKDMLDKLNDILSKCKNVTICTRETESYNYAKENLKNIKVELIPDMVLSQKWTQKSEKQNKVCFCMRKDHEKVLKEDDQTKMEQEIKTVLPDAEIFYTDTMHNCDVQPDERESVVKSKIREFSSCKIVITDRLHGMVLSAVSGSKTIVWSNCNYKVLGTYNWIKNNSYIGFVSNMEEFKLKLAEFAKSKDVCEYSNEEAIKHFDVLKKIIG